MIEYKLDIPSLTEDGIQMEDSFYDVKELNSSSMIDLSIIIKMLILLIDSFDRRVIILGIVDIQNDCMMCKWIVFVDNEWDQSHLISHSLESWILGDSYQFI